MGLSGVACGMGYLSWMKRRKGVGVFWRKLRGVRVARTHGAALAGLAILAGFGCEASPAPASTSRDSLGVRIVESVSPRWSENSAWWIDEAPLVDLLESGTGEERFFDRVRDVLRAADGRLIVGDGASSEVRMYDASGRFVRTLSGEGDGPGEFRYLVDTDVAAQRPPGGPGLRRGRTRRGVRPGLRVGLLVSETADGGCASPARPFRLPVGNRRYVGIACGEEHSGVAAAAGYDRSVIRRPRFESNGRNGSRRRDLHRHGRRCDTAHAAKAPRGCDGRR